MLGNSISDVGSDTKSLWKGDGWRRTVSNDEDVDQSSGVNVSLGVLEGDDINLTWLGNDVGDDTNSSLIVTVGSQSDVSNSLLVELEDLTSFNAVLDGVSVLDSWVSESDSSSVMGDNVWDLVWSNELLDDLAELVLITG